MWWMIGACFIWGVIDLIMNFAMVAALFKVDEKSASKKKEDAA